MLGFALLSYQQVTRQLERDADARIAQEAKQIGMSVLERLLLLEDALATLEPGGLGGSGMARGRFRGFETVPSGSLAAVASAQLAAGDSVLRVTTQEGASRILLLRRTRAGAVIAAEIEPRFLFVPEGLRASVGLVVRSEGAPLFAAPRSAPGLEQRSGSWNLFLRPQLHGPTWTIELSEPLDSSLAPLDGFRAIFPLVTLLALLAVGLATLVLVRRSLVPIELLHAATGRLARRDFTTRVGLRSGDEFEDLAASFDAMAASIERHVSVVETVSSIGRALSVEQDAERLLGTILRGTMQVTDARSGALSLADADDRLVQRLLLEAGGTPDPGLRARLERVAAAASAAGRTLHDAAQGELSIPMRNHEDAVIGMLQLVRPGGFDAEGLALAESLASQTAVALTRHRLAGEFRALFEGLIQLIVKAIDQKSPYTGEHCRRVPILTELIADAACQSREGALKDFSLSDTERYELRIAALLHDCGKVTTPVHVIDKSSKLETLFDRIALVDARLEVVKRELALEALRARRPEETRAADDPALAARLAALESDRAFLHWCNQGRERSAPGDLERVRAIAARWQWQRPDGVLAPILDDEEVENLCVVRGTLNRRERAIIEHHVVASIEMLEQLPYPRALANVPAIAGPHHERMDGHGYPKGLVRDQISMQGRILGLADVFEALTSSDRPYKKPMALRQALSVLEEMRDEGHIDRDLFEVFMREKVYLRYAAEYLDPEQIDEELLDEAARALLATRVEATS